MTGIDLPNATPPRCDTRRSADSTHLESQNVKVIARSCRLMNMLPSSLMSMRGVDCIGRQIAIMPMMLNQSGFERDTFTLTRPDHCISWNRGPPALRERDHPHTERRDHPHTERRDHPHTERRDHTHTLRQDRSH